MKHNKVLQSADHHPSVVKPAWTLQKGNSGCSMVYKRDKGLCDRPEQIQSHITGRTTTYENKGSVLRKRVVNCNVLQEKIHMQKSTELKITLIVTNFTEHFTKFCVLVFTVTCLFPFV